MDVCFHAFRSRGESGVYVLDPNTHECLHYEPVVGYPAKSHVSVPREILAEHPEVEVRYDLIDCSIDVCSVEVGSASLHVLLHAADGHALTARCRFPRCSRITSIMGISGETLSTAFSRPTS